MGLQIRDDRQMKAFTGLSQAQFDSLLPVFRDLYQATQQKTCSRGCVWNAQAQTGRRLQRPTAHAGREAPLRPLFLHDLSDL